MELLKKEKYNFEDLKEIMRILRSENGCPWDREQTHESIRNNFIEEVYEAIEAIDEKNHELLREELGDVLLQIIFHSQISSENGEFDADGVCGDICRKLIIRHPHIFSDVIADNSTNELSSFQVLSNWENIKIEEKGYNNTREYIESTAKSLPALMRAEKIQKRFIKRKVIEKPGTEDILKNLRENLSELNERNVNEEDVGRLLYDVVSLANEHNISAEQALYDYNKKIIKKM